MMTDDIGEFSVCSKSCFSVDVELNQTCQFRFSLTQLDYRQSLLFSRVKERNTECAPD
jgi:hypothetical protein